MSTITNKQPWIQNAAYDGAFILLPGLLSLVIVALLPNTYKTTNYIPDFAWVVLVLLVDVAHVYSTLFRTYFVGEEFRRRKTLYLLAPAVCYLAGVLLYALGAAVFWRVLAYFAVFHFIRQQYGFMRLYTRTETKGTYRSWLDAIAVYTATLYPLVYWHCTPGRNFNWFVAGDFLLLNNIAIKQAGFVLYLAILALYAASELWHLAKGKGMNLPKNMVIAGTALTWYFGIVHYNGDLAFTLLNVVAHGIPYMALIWILQHRQDRRPIKNTSLNILASVAIFVVTVVALSYFEEGLWDGLVWRDHTTVFSPFAKLPQVQHHEWLTLLVPLLSLPQATHYFLDGFIWKRGK